MNRNLPAPIEVTYSRVDDDPYEEGYVYCIHVHDIGDNFYVTFETEATDAIMHYVIYAYMVGRNHGTSIMAEKLESVLTVAIQETLEDIPNTECADSYSINGELIK